MSALSDKALEIAITQIGQEEKPLGSNWGSPVKEYLASVGIGFPAAWCMSFMYWCFREASKQLRAPNTAVKTGGVLSAWNKASKEFKANKPSVGSLFIEDHGHGLGHTGIVASFDNEFIYTIEGNTNNNGTREGVRVERKKRAISSPLIKGYINY